MNKHDIEQLLKSGEADSIDFTLRKDLEKTGELFRQHIELYNGSEFIDKIDMSLGNPERYYENVRVPLIIGRIETIIRDNIVGKVPKKVTINCLNLLVPEDEGIILTPTTINDVTLLGRFLGGIERYNDLRKHFNRIGTFDHEPNIVMFNEIWNYYLNEYDLRSEVDFGLRSSANN